MAGGITRTTRCHPPSHYLFKIEAFSLLVESKVDKFKSNAFEACGHQWRLVLYPTGNKKSNGGGYISLYLEIEKSADLSLDWEVNVDFKLFVFDQIRDQYLVIKDMEVPIRRFYEMKTEWGFSQLLSQKTFKNAENGYLVDDCCTFGAEVLVIQRTPKVEKAMVKKPIGGTITWKMHNFSKLDQNFYSSPVVSIDGIKWNLLVYPKGDTEAKDTHLSVFLELANPLEYRFTSSSTNWGYYKFVPLKDVYDSSKGYLVKDGLIVEAEFNLICKVE
ncbi:hypothetical protein V6N12_045955 [Hibiscus sabdariffa]|uniref:MATH domain-containing protein n=1 Tax=Hibiscus sabdariffa TaxID=183260 RepID=A0ABR2G479_9ROSI